MQNIPFIKMHALGNDFVIIDNNKDKVFLKKEQVKLICNRHLGIGCDQLLIVSPIKDKIYEYTIFNADGSGALNCLNGARCVTKYLFNKYSLVDDICLQLSTRKIYSKYDILTDLVIINVGEVNFNSKSIGFRGKITKNNVYKMANSDIIFAIAEVGNPHAIIKVKDIKVLDNKAELFKVVQKINDAEVFLNGVNINFYFLKGDQLYIKTFERGSGFTEFCGSGAVATACYLIKLNNLSNALEVHSSLGKVTIKYDSEKAILIGNATFVFEGNIYI